MTALSWPAVLDHLRDVEVMAEAPGVIRAQCQRCLGRMTREGSVDLYRLVEMFAEHAAACTPMDPDT